MKKIRTESLYTKSDFFSCGRSGCVITSNDLTDQEALRELMRAVKNSTLRSPTLADLESKILVNVEHKRLTDVGEALSALLSGDALLFLDNERDCVSVNVRCYEVRSVTEPPTSSILKGPREGFIESMKTNLSLLERKLRTPDLEVRHVKVGNVSPTDVAVVSINGRANDKIAQKIVHRLSEIDVPTVLDAQQLQSFLEERPYSIFNQSGLSEKPDVVASKLLEGRVAVLCDGSPVVVTFPYLFLEDVQSDEDYYERPSYASLLRVVRIISLSIGIFLPGFYVAIEIFHFAVFPLQLLLTVISATQSLPLPALGELLFVLLLFEIIREAGVRMPQAMGLAMSVVGALVLGETAVKAGVIGSPAVMVVALSSIATYTVPNSAGSSSLLRIVFTLVGGLLGFYGLVVGGLWLLTYVCSLGGYGAPFLAPYAPYVGSDTEDGLLKAPMVDVNTSPFSVPNAHGRKRNNFGSE